MPNPEKCFCPQYVDCQSNPNKQVYIGYDPAKGVHVYRTGEAFVAHADKICPGTIVTIADVALNGGGISVDQATATLPAEAVTLECEYFNTVFPKT